MVIAAGLNDEKNIVKCIEAQEYGIEKVLAINNDRAYYNLMHSLGIVVVRGSKIGAYYAILEKIASTSVVTERHFCGGQGVIFMRKVDVTSSLLGKSTLSCRVDDYFMCILRDDRIVTLDDASVFQKGDILVVSAHVEKEEKIQKWIVTL
jgi:trk system potassium uptake protein TrkA